MKNELIQFDEDATVILVDWRGGSSPPYYQAVANIRIVGAIVAHFVMALKFEFDLPNLDNFHLIGHSLGAHLSGYAGYVVQRDFDEVIGRITGEQLRRKFIKIDIFVIFSSRSCEALF